MLAGSSNCAYFETEYNCRMISKHYLVIDWSPELGGKHFIIRNQLFDDGAQSVEYLGSTTRQYHFRVGCDEKNTTFSCVKTFCKNSSERALLIRTRLSH